MSKPIIGFVFMLFALAFAEDDELCQSDAAIDCASCAEFAPCLSSIDPHCISTAALDCLPCETYAECAACAPGWDPNCYTLETYQDAQCTIADITNSDDEVVLITWRADGQCGHQPSFNITMISDCTTGIHKYECDATCSECEVEHELPAAQCTDVTNENDEAGLLVRGTCEAGKTIACPSGLPCGPEHCETGDKCITIGIFGTGSTCSDDATTFDYTAKVIADGECHMDGSGRSYYRAECSGGMGRGVIGCSNSACTEGCTAMSEIEPNTCDSPDWANGLTLIFVGDEEAAECSQDPTFDEQAIASGDGGDGDGDGDGDSDSDGGDSGAGVVQVGVVFVAAVFASLM